MGVERAAACASGRTAGGPRGRGRRRRPRRSWPAASRGATSAGVAPGGEVGLGGEPTAAGGVASGLRWPSRKWMSRLGVGELGQAVEARGQVAAGRVGVDLARHLDEDAPLGRPWRPGRRRSGVPKGLSKGVARKIEPSTASAKSGLSTREVADLRVVRAARARWGVGRLGRVLGGGAGAEPGADRGVDRHPVGQRDDGLRSGEGARRVRFEEARVVDFEVEAHSPRARRRGG